MKIYQNITLKQIMDEVKSGKQEFSRVVMGQHVGWTHDFKHCMQAPSGLPITRYGSPMVENSAISFMHLSAIASCERYGKYPIDALLAMHFANFEATKEEIRSLEVSDFVKYVENKIDNGEWKQDNSYNI